MKINVRQRKRKAYRVSFSIAWSYIRLYLVKKLIPNSVYDRIISKLHQKNANKAKSAILELDGLFIKVGQLLSIMSSVLPEAFGEALESLQDNTPASDFEYTKKTIESELGEPLKTLFSSFEETPIASASIGQVHKAILKSGEKVAVKVQHHQIETLAKLDLDTIEGLIKLVIRFFKINGLDHVYKQVRQMINEELDYCHEADSMVKIKANCQEIEGIIIPEVYSAYCSKKVLVTQFHEGTKLTNVEVLKSWNIIPESIVDRLIFVYCEMILKHGVYHADPHPGNLLVNQNGEIIILDFGAIGELDEGMRSQIPIFIQAIVYKDLDKVLESMRKMGFIGKGEAAEKTAEKIIEAISNFISEGIDISDLSIDTIKNSNIEKLRKELSIKELTSAIEVPKDWILLERVLLLLFGISTKVAPEYNPMDTVKPYMKQLIFKEEGFRKIILNALKHQANILLGIPKKTDEFLTKANKGKLEIQIKGYEFHSKRQYALGHQIVFAILAFFSFCMAFFSHAEKLDWYEDSFMVLGSILTGLYFISIWRNRMR